MTPVPEAYAGAPPQPSTGAYRGLLTLILLGGCALRLWRIRDQVVIDDEWHALNAVQYFDAGWILTHFGTADISIPLALLYEWQQRWFGLSELLLRWPMLAAGAAAIVLVPHLLRTWLDRRERLLLAALIAVSPFLVYYSRFARPYALLALLGCAAVVLAWRWWQAGRPGLAAGWAGCAALSAWLNPAALAVAAAPFAWLGLQALRTGISGGGWRPLTRLAAVGLATVALLAALLGPPLATDFASFAGKAAQHEVSGGTLGWVLSLAAGSGHVAAYAALGLVALWGLHGLYRRDPGFAVYLAVTALLAGAAVSLSGAAWVKHGPVFLRYLVGLLPLFLATVAIGLAQAAALLARRSTRGHAAWSLLFVAVLVAVGPLPDWPWRHGQFVQHQYYQFHYDPARNALREYVDGWYRTEAFYTEIAALHPAGDAVIVEAPWWLESFYNPLHLQQAAHGQRVQVGFVNGVCAGPLYGELRAGQQGMGFRNFVTLAELLDGTRSADYLVLRRQGLAPPPARQVEMDYATCERAVRERFGAPWRATGDALVFRLGGRPAG